MTCVKSFFAIFQRHNTFGFGYILHILLSKQLNRLIFKFPSIYIEFGITFTFCVYFVWYSEVAKITDSNRTSYFFLSEFFDQDTFSVKKCFVRINIFYFYEIIPFGVLYAERKTVKLLCCYWDFFPIGQNCKVSPEILGEHSFFDKN